MNRKEGWPTPQPEPDDQPDAENHLAPEINNAFSESEIWGGADLKKLKVGRKLLVTTKHRIYTIEKRPDGLYISGHPELCPAPVKVEIPGSTFGGSMLHVDFIGRGMFMEFKVEGKNTKKTSQILDVEEE